MRIGTASKPAVLERVLSEMEEFAIIAGYLFTVFAVVLYYKSTILSAEGIHWAPLGFAAVKTMIAAKIILIGRAFHVGERHRAKPLIWQTVHKSLAFLTLIYILTIVEEVVVGFIHGRTIGQSVADLAGGTTAEIIATGLIVFLVFLPLFAFNALTEVMGGRALFRVFFVERTGFEVIKEQVKQRTGT